MIFHPQLQKSSKPQQQSRALLISDLTSQLGDLTSDNAMKNMNMIFCKNLLENDAPIY